MAVQMWVFCLIFGALGFTVIGKSVKNPADALAEEINRNLTASKLPKLKDSPGLACIALQYIQAYKGNCDKVDIDGEKPSEDEFKSTFSENCGVNPSSVSDITGRVLACQSGYRDAGYAFSELLFKDKSGLAKLQNTNQSEFGVGISGYQGGGPYFWCVLFSNAQQNSSSFTFVGSKAKNQQTGCFSGTGDPCSGSQHLLSSSTSSLIIFLAMILLLLL